MSNPTPPQHFSPVPANRPEKARPSRRQGIRTALVVVGTAIAMLATNAVASALENPVVSILVGPLLAVAMIWLYVWVGTRVERRRVAERDVRAGIRPLLLGVTTGVTLAAVTIGVLALLGAYEITGWGSITGALAVMGMMCAVAVAEEVFFRGIVFRLLQGRWDIVVALAVSSLLFGLLHLLNPGASLGGALSIAVEAGLMLGAAYLLTGSLWLAIGIHLGWNVAIGALFGTVVSGSEARESLFTAVTVGPDWLTGGAFGPEASIVAIIVCSVTTVVFLVAAHRRGRLSYRGA